MKVIQGHLTAHDKKAIKAILNLNLAAGVVNRKTYHLFNNGDNYTVKITQKDRGLIPCAGSQLRESTYTHKFIL